MKKSKILIVLLLTFIMLANLTACGESQDADTETQNTATGSGSQIEPDESFDATFTYSEDTSITGAVYTSTGTDENGLVC